MSSGPAAEIAGPDSETPAVPPPARLLLWETGDFEQQITACNGCGTCRTGEPERRMCPMFRVSHTEDASPRAKANMLRGVLADDPRNLGGAELRAVADLCVNCKMCANECPAAVNIPKLMLEAKAANFREHGLERSDWMLARLDAAVALGSTFPFVANTLIGSRMFRWMIEKLFGLSRSRRLASFAPRNFLKRARRKGWTRKRETRNPDRVAYFVDIFPNAFDPLIAEATVEVLRHQGIHVYVPPDQRSCGMTALSLGDVELARDTVRHNLRVFADLAREGYTIVCSEPTAALMLRHDALDLVDDPDARAVAERTVELTEFLWRLHERGRLRTDFRPLETTLGHHVPCHVKALNRGVHGPALLGLIPRLRVRTIDVSCSGMAGTYGLTAKNHAASIEAGRPMLDELRRPGVAFGSTECGSCRMQMEQSGGRRTLHPVQYLALAYGLVPEINRRLARPLRGLAS